METIQEIVRDAENNYINSKAKISKYVTHSMSDTLEQIDAYLNSTHISGSTDALGRDKPFFDIVTAAANVWFRATDIDRSNIKVRATKEKDYINSFVATLFLRRWMNKSGFGSFLNEWGRVLARYGSAVIKTVENSSGLHVSIIPWNRLIVDQIDFDAAPVIEIIELSEGQLRRRVETHGYDEQAVKELIEADQVRRNKDKTHKDNINDFIRVYEVHGEMPKSLLTGKESDEEKYVQQMQVVSFVENRKGRKSEYQDFTLVKGEEKKSPYRITHLVKEDGRTLAKGAVEHLFEAQWMQNHSMKAMKDTLDLAGKIIFQTADESFVGRNFIQDIETGDIFTHAENKPLTQVNSQAHDLTSWQNYAVQWKQLGNEINGISEAMLGAAPASGTAWRQTEALLSESHSLFELMTENKGLAIEDMLREDVIPYLKHKVLNETKEFAAQLEMNDITQIDERFIKAKAAELHNKASIDQFLGGQIPTSTPEMQAQNVQEQLKQYGNTRFFKPSELEEKTWKEQFKDMEWDLEIDITGEPRRTAEAMATLNTALQVAANPGFVQNKTAQTIVGKILELTGTMSALELASMQNQQPSGSMQLSNITPQQNATTNTTAAA